MQLALWPGTPGLVQQHIRRLPCESAFDSSPGVSCDIPAQGLTGALASSPYGCTQQAVGNELIVQSTKAQRLVQLLEITLSMCR